MILATDIHGAHYTFLRLLAKCPREDVKNNDIVLLGDLIDRGSHSREMVEWAMSNGVTTLCGNHEDLALAHHNVPPNCGKEYQYGVWNNYNGGDVTLNSFGQDYVSGKLPGKVLEWMSKLPVYHIDSRYPDLFLSHTGHGKSADKGDRFTALWSRDHNFRDDGKYRIFGHTPNLFPIFKKNYAMIDTGAAYESRGYGTMTAMIWPSKEIIQQKYDETPFSLTVMV